jgi:DNA-binding NarL/FixJ family response regulator
VLDFLIQGMTNKEIAGHLRIKERSVKYHVSQLLSLYAVGNRAELIARVLSPTRGRQDPSI